MKDQGPMTAGEAAYEWLTSLASPEDQGDCLKLQLAVNDRCHSLQLRSWRHGERDAPLMTEQAQGFVSALRDGMHDCGWPFQISVSIHGRESWATGVRIESIGIAGAEPRSGIRDGGSWRWDRKKSIDLVDEALRGSHLIGSILRPSNQPVRAWSSGSNMIGSPHVHHDAIHARSEAEFLLKKIWMNEGNQGVEKIIENGRLETKDWLSRMWFVASDLEDLDTNPLGRQLGGDEAVDAINEMLDLSKTPSPEAF